jgi:hypothetical protein
VIDDVAGREGALETVGAAVLAAGAAAELGAPQLHGETLEASKIAPFSDDRPHLLPCGEELSHERRA